MLYSLLLCASFGHSMEPPIFNATESNDGRLNLSGRWLASYLIETDGAPSINALLAEDTHLITIPGYIDQTDAQSARSASFLIRLIGLSEEFRQPTIRMHLVDDAWTAYWLEDNQLTYLGGSGSPSDYPENQVAGYRFGFLMLPVDSKDGVLIIQNSSHMFGNAGLRSPMMVEEFDQALRIQLLDLASRALVMGIGFYVIIQNLIYFLLRRKERSMLLIALFALAVMLRAVISSDYVLFFTARPDWQVTVMKLEYFLIVWPALAAVHFLLYYFPTRFNKPLLLFGYVSLTLCTLFTIAQPIQAVTNALSAYQLLLGCYVLIALSIVIKAVVEGSPKAYWFLLSFLPMVLAVINDVYAARTVGYSLYIAEYALFVFLLTQTLVFSARYVRSLDMAEHLTENLQIEVDRKTAELQARNQELHDKAIALEQQHEKIKLISQVDHLTGLFNRQTLDKHMRHVYEYAITHLSPLSVILMDLDHFKSINDQYGHGVGDECLIFVASHLRGIHLRNTDLIARFGGEEIIIVLPGSSLEAAAAIAERLCTSLPEHPVIGEHPDIHLTASFGVAELHKHQASSPEMLIDFADRALYQAKAKGRHCVVPFQST